MAFTMLPIFTLLLCSTISTGQDSIDASTMLKPETTPVSFDGPGTSILPEATNRASEAERTSSSAITFEPGSASSDSSTQQGSVEMTTEGVEDIYEEHRRRTENTTEHLEKRLKTFIKGAVKRYLPMLMQHSDGALNVSSRCMNSLMKYVAGLSGVKVWAIKMFDATSKPASGAFEGTISDFGAFDQCLDIEMPKRSGELEFRGQYCAIEVQPRMPPVPDSFTLAKLRVAHPHQTIKDELRIAGQIFYYLRFRFGACVPSTCALQDIQAIAHKVSEIITMNVKVPQCYTKENTVFKPIHIAVICFLSLLLVAGIAGSSIEFWSTNRRPGTLAATLRCFSFIGNGRRLLSASQGSEEMKALHGIRTFTMAWVLLGHTYVWNNFTLLRRPVSLTHWIDDIEFEVILNGWLAVEPFFFLSGLLTCFAVLKMMEKTKGRINVPIYILRRYIRLTPSLLLTFGLAFFMPLVSSGPFWYDRVDPELQSCRNNWWTSILYFSNWTGLKNICVHPTWYLSADFQLYIFSIIILYMLYKSPKVGLTAILVVVIACCTAVGFLTYSYDLPPIILTASGNDRKVMETVDVVHMRTFTHAGPYYVGFVVGYLMIKFKDIKMSRVACSIGWATSFLLSVLSLYGAHRWNTGEPHGPILTILYAAVHRTTFTMGVAWVTFACVTGHGGPVNKFLSSALLAPLGRLTFCVYLLHSLVIWVRSGSMRERMFFSHYNIFYEYAGNVFISVMLSVPFYLLLEAPLSNLDRMVFSRAADKSTQKEPVPENLKQKEPVVFEKRSSPPAVVELTAVKSLDLLQNGALVDHPQKI